MLEAHAEAEARPAVGASAWRSGVAVIAMKTLPSCVPEAIRRAVAGRARGGEVVVERVVVVHRGREGADRVVAEARALA